MARIGLVDVDGHNFPNFALMKISAFHKNQGDHVEWADAMFGGDYDKVYMSKIFTFSPDYPFQFDCEVIKGGTGYDVRSRLPEEIEQSQAMDYSIYPDCNYSLQFFSRGCIRKCPFCLVRDKEGYIHPAEPVDLNPKGEWIEVLDNNFFANPEWKSAVDYLIGYNSTKEQDLFRIETLRKFGIVPFVQPYRDFENKRTPTQYEKDLARWANNKFLYKSCSFEDFEPRKGFKCKEYFK